jgi:NifU-like protein involved in Fe-S cluster formation
LVRTVALSATPPYTLRVTSALYDRDILRLAASIPHQRRLLSPQGSAERRSPVCGSRVAVDIDLDAQGVVVAFGQEVNACALGQASAALLGAHTLGRTASQIAAARDALAAFLQGTRDDPGTWPGLSILDRARPYPARHASILLPFQAAAEAVAHAGAHEEAH